MAEQKELEGDDLALVIDGVSYELGDLTIQECAQLEEAFDLPLSEIDMTRALAIQHLVWFAKKRKDPSFSFEDAGMLPITVLNEPEENGDVPPTKPKAKRKAA